MDYRRPRQLSKSLILLCIFCASIGIVALSAEELPRVKVTGDRVNVRVRADINSEVVTQLSKGEEVVVLERGEEWTKILAPNHSKCWVHNECIDGTRIKIDSTNLRCGPGIAFPVLAKLQKGTQVNIIEVFGEWIRVEPPVEFGVWVSSKYLEFKDQPKIIEELPKHPEPETEQESEPTVKTTSPIPQIISVTGEEISGVEIVSYAGRLENLGVIINRPGTYKLVDNKNRWICIIRSSTLDINPYVKRDVRIEGVVLSKSSSWNVPVIELKRLTVIK